MIAKMQKKINGDQMNNEEKIDELLSDINSCNNFYIIANEESIILADELHKRLEEQDISSSIISKGMENSFKEDLNEDDLVLVISKSGREDYIRTMVKSALKTKTKVYAICTDFKSPLALFANRTITIKETDDFKQETSKIIDYICKNLTKDTGNKKPKKDPRVHRIFSNLSMIGIITKINVKVGDEIKSGDTIMVMEAMKMESELCSDKDGIVEKIPVELGDSVSPGDPIMEIKLSE